MEQSKFYQIKNITEQEYTLVSCDGSLITRQIQDIDKSASAFTIEDAKDGDVLVSSSGKPFIFKGFFDNDPMAYGGLVADDSFWPASNSNWTTVYCKPATKEQRDLLFQKVKEAGYEWDAEKKELKKIEQKPTDEEMKIILNTEYEKGRADAIAEVQKPAWSEEDEINLFEVTMELEYRSGLFQLQPKDYSQMIDWLKSLKERYA